MSGRKEDQRMDRYSDERPERRKERRRKRSWLIWNRIVLCIGYGTILYHAVRGIIYLLVLAEEWIK